MVYEKKYENGLRLVVKRMEGLMVAQILLLVYYEENSRN